MRFINNNKSKNRQIIIGFLLVNLVVFYMLLFISFYLAYAEEIINVFISFDYVYYLILLLILIVIRIFIVSYLSYSFFKEWKSHKQYNFIGFHFLFGLYFYLMIIYKPLDLIVYITYADPEFFSTEFVLNIYKIRHLIGALSTLPLLTIGSYLFFYNRNLKEEILEREKNAKKKVKIISLIWIVLYMFIIIIATSAVFLLLIFILFNIVNLLIVWVFFKAYKGKILSEINCLIISIGFVGIFIAGYLPTILIFSLLGTSIYGLLIGALISEIGALISWIIVLIGFKTKSNY